MFSTCGNMDSYIYKICIKYGLQPEGFDTFANKKRDLFLNGKIEEFSQLHEFLKKNATVFEHNSTISRSSKIDHDSIFQGILADFVDN